MTVWGIIRLICAGIFLCSGLFMMITSLIGNFRFNYVLCRMHAAGIGDTLGIALIFLAITVLEGISAFTLKLWLILILLWISSPTTSHRIMKMEIENGSKAGKETKQ